MTDSMISIIMRITMTAKNAESLDFHSSELACLYPVFYDARNV